MAVTPTHIALTVSEASVVSVWTATMETDSVVLVNDIVPSFFSENRIGEHSSLS